LTAIREILSLSYVASRTIEATIIGVGAISLLSVVTLRDHLAASIGANGTSLDIAGQTLVAIHDGRSCSGRDSASASTASCSAG
jgi:hypothetical protein